MFYATIFLAGNVRAITRGFATAAERDAYVAAFDVVSDVSDIVTYET